MRGAVRRRPGEPGAAPAAQPGSAQHVADGGSRFSALPRPGPARFALLGRRRLLRHPGAQPPSRYRLQQGRAAPGAGAGRVPAAGEGVPAAARGQPRLAAAVASPGASWAGTGALGLPGSAAARGGRGGGGCAVRRGGGWGWGPPGLTQSRAGAGAAGHLGPKPCVAGNRLGKNERRVQQLV